MKNFIKLLTLFSLFACQSTPSLEEDVRYTKLAIVIDKHVFTDMERKQARESVHSNIGLGLGIGSGSNGGFGGIMLGVGNHHNSNDIVSQIAKGANRYTIRPVWSKNAIEFMSYAQYQVGDCVKVLVGHPTEYPRFIERKAGEHCN